MQKNTLNPKSDLPQGTQSISRTILLLRTIADHNEKGLRLTEIVRKVKIPKATVYRLLSVLVSEQFIDLDPDSKCYHIGIGLYSLGVKAEQFAIREKYRFCLEKIAEETSAATYLVIRSGIDALCIDFIEGRTPFRVVAYSIGFRTVLGFGAASLAILSSLKDNEVKSILRANEERYIKYYGITADRIKSMIKKVRKLGYVFSESYHFKGMNGVAVPIFNEDGNAIAAISIGAIADQLDFKSSKYISKFMKSEIQLIR